MFLKSIMLLLILYDVAIKSMIVTSVAGLTFAIESVRECVIVLN